MTKVCKNLKLILHRLEAKQDTELGQTFAIPGIWHMEKVCDETVEVNPFKYLSSYIRKELLPKANVQAQSSLLPLSFSHPNREWLTQDGIYCLDVRTASSWDHDGDGNMVEHHGEWTEMGTFLKTLFLLPHIKRLGLKVLYLLPVLKPSKAYAKGELGSFYAINNFYELNPDLHDSLLDLPQKPFSIEVEFKALVEACHLLGIRVIFDFPLRTASRDNDLLVEHPEWFYWIYVKDLDKYQVPYYANLPSHVPPTIENLHAVYSLPETNAYRRFFSFPPNQVDAVAWKSLKERYLADPTQNILEMVEAEFGLTTAPAYSDWLNDPQPSWDDITFLKLYLDAPSVRDGYFADSEPPFLFFDAIKTNLYPGKVQNKELWEYLGGIIRFYQANYGIDGARIDMAHALPEELEALIMHQSLSYNSEFKFISEELQNSKHELAHQKGYHCIIGETWGVEGNITEENFRELLQKLPRLSIPSFACAETPDTPRAAVRRGGRIFSLLVAVMNFFLPNSVVFVNNGFELYEQQPMNLGLDNTEAGRFILPDDELYYGRLAFFDRYQLHWLTEGASELVDLLNRAGQVREKFRDLLQNLQNFYLAPLKQANLVHFGYRNAEEELTCLANLDFTSPQLVRVKGQLLISSVLSEEEDLLQPGEFRVHWLKF